DGSWSLLDEVEEGVIPPDLEDAFKKYPDARKNFEAFPRGVRRGILEWVTTAKRDATREKRVQETARLAQDNIRANQWR
ncbi:MAG: YdeI/OmpD-associated family protein, partial [Anaerolineales bacterium]|nr:YdeI/OmpD-associated family protein [Anaerolineales bacterium]